jgi:hypothetical protein
MSTELALTVQGSEWSQPYLTSYWWGDFLSIQTSYESENKSVRYVFCTTGESQRIFSCVESLNISRLHPRDYSPTLNNRLVVQMRQRISEGCECNGVWEDEEGIRQQEASQPTFEIFFAVAPKRKSNMNHKNSVSLESVSIPIYQLVELISRFWSGRASPMYYRAEKEEEGWYYDETLALLRLDTKCSTGNCSRMRFSY